MDLNLKGKVVGISGAASRNGIGYAIAVALLQEGCRVAICDVAEPALADAQADLARYGEVWCGKADVSDESSVRDFFGGILQRFGQLDIWINNAGIYPQKLLNDMSVAEWDRIMSINVRSVLICTQAANAAMTHGGVIINAASYAALIGSAGSGAYAASKAAVLSLTKTFAAELAPRGIRVNAYIPGVIATGMTADVISQKGDGLLSQIAIGRLGRPADVANAVVFLASDAAGYLTGMALEVSGGKLCVQNPDYAWKLGQQSQGVT